ncbi:DUF3783 domain-containing protein [Oceanispirochaeta sp.]|jgi:hypothetical protein|uniref:DUF3783 domain-containing protein n=1 Tax=Oceanispirochaeta sp. TaxID=2035350 RepID=UPI0026226511|nr:DUF3783 domain-containing protein [Oceanispirochaeta sp.]MDA3955725.1 DUF3783 domain-containing protein [Oceanispirochaeta sp.]
MQQEMCLFRGFTKEQASQALALLSQEGGAFHTAFSPMTDSMGNLKMEDLIAALFEGTPLGGQALTEGQRVVLMAVSQKERAVTVMRAIKTVSENPQDIVFAMVTQTALQWTLQEYIDHVSEEHEYMKTHNPAEDPDMKKV